MSYTDSYRHTLQAIFQKAGIQLDGNQSWDIQVHHPDFYKRVLKSGSLGFGESYVMGLWDCQQLDDLFFRILRADLQHAAGLRWPTIGLRLKAMFWNMQTVQRAKQVAIQHYDIGNDLYRAMLDKRMMYSCGYWQSATTLDEAQEAKLNLICRKLKLAPGMRILDIGCGWGGFARYAAERYGVEVVGITLSNQQAEEARRVCKGLSIEIRIQDYRKIDEPFDRVVSIGMFEHVGYKNYSTYMQVVHRVLKRNGLFLLHCIGGNTSTVMTDPWINKYIFPNGMIPSAVQITQAFEKIFILEDWHNIGLHYDPTLMAWRERFQTAWPVLKEQYDERFYRMWMYYLSCSAASFRAKHNNLWQIVLSRREDQVDYRSVR